MKKTVFLLLIALLLAGCQGAPFALSAYGTLDVTYTQDQTSQAEPPSSAASAEITAAPETTPEPTPTPEATPTPEPTPSPEPTPTPDPWAVYFTAEERIKIKDGESWSYTSPELAVFVEKRYVNGCRSWCFIAHIYNRGAKDMMDGINIEDGDVVRMRPNKFAQKFRAVWGLTGTYFSHSLNADQGPDIRNGILHKDFLGETCMGMLADGTLIAYRQERDEYTAESLMEMGVIRSYAFGPILVENGEVCENLDEERRSSRNPRSAFGMAEPGHYVGIMVDGRKPGVSLGSLHSELAQLFVDEGCTVAYNMDGGQTAAMVFMGEILNDHVGATTNETRAVPDMILFGTSELVPALEP